MKFLNANRFLRIVLLVALVMACSDGVDVAAQAVNKQAPQKPAVVFGQSRADSASSPEEMLVALKLYVEEVQLTLDLEQRQVRRLNLAAKLVAQRVFDENAPMFIAPIKGSLKSTNVEESFSDEDSEAAVDQAAFEKLLTEMRKPVAVQTALQHKVWLKTIDTVLSDDQKTDVKTLDEKRLKKMRAAAVEYRVWGMAEQLRLRDDQIEEIAKIVDRVEGDKLLNQLRSGPRNRRAARMGRAGGRGFHSVTAGELADVLTKQQLQKFKSMQSDQEDPLGGLFGGLLGINETQKVDAGKIGLAIKSSSGRLIVSSVKEGSRGQKMGIQKGDIIDQANGKPVDTPFQLNAALKASDQITLTVMRDKQSIKLMENDK